MAAIVLWIFLRSLSFWWIKVVLPAPAWGLMKAISDHFKRIKKFTEILTKEESRTLVATICKLLKGIKSFDEIR